MVVFSLLCASPEVGVVDSDKPVKYDDMEKDEYSLPLPDLIGADIALPVVIRKISLLSEIEKNSQGQVRFA